MSLSVCGCEEVGAAAQPSKAAFEAAAVSAAAGGDSGTRSSRPSRIVKKDKAPLRPRHVRTPGAPRRRSFSHPRTSASLAEAPQADEEAPPLVSSGFLFTSS